MFCLERFTAGGFTLDSRKCQTLESSRQRRGLALLVIRAVAEQQALRPSFVSLLAFKIQQLAWQREPPGSYDQAYWEQQGWLAPERMFYMAHRATRLKVTLARLAGAVLAQFMIG